MSSRNVSLAAVDCGSAAFDTPPQSNRVELSDRLKSLEEQLLSPSFRMNAAAVAALLTEDFKEVGASGRVFDKAAILRELQQEAPARLTLEHFKACLLSADVALVTYVSTRSTSDNDLCARRSSIWVHQQGTWRLRFHQGTRMP